jgi:hypothetical protein
MERFVLFFATNGNRRRWLAVLAVLAGLVLMSCSGGGDNRGIDDWSGGDPTYSAGGNSAPVADAGADQNVVIGTVVSLDGSGSYDADEDQLTYLWEFTSIPSGSFAALSDPAIVNPTFTPDQYGSYLIELTVNDGYINSAGDVITVNLYSDYALYFSSESSGLTISSSGYFWPDSSFGLTISNHANIPFRCYRAELLNGGLVIGSTEDPQYLGGEQIEPGEDVGVTFKLTSYIKDDGLEIRFYLLRPDTDEHFTVSQSIEPPND